MYDVGVSGFVSDSLPYLATFDLRLEYFFVGSCDQTADQVHLAERSAAIAIQRRFLTSQHHKSRFFRWEIITTILSRPIRPTEYILKVIGHRVSTLAREMRWALRAWKVLVTNGTKVKVGR